MVQSLKQNCALLKVIYVHLDTPVNMQIEWIMPENGLVGEKVFNSCQNEWSYFLSGSIYLERKVVGGWRKKTTFLLKSWEYCLRDS